MNEVGFSLMNGAHCVLYFECSTRYIMWWTFLVACSRCSHSGGLYGSREEDDLVGGLCVWSRTVFLCSGHLFPQSVGHAVALSRRGRRELWTRFTFPPCYMQKTLRPYFPISVSLQLYFSCVHTALVSPWKVSGGPSFSVISGQMSSCFCFGLCFFFLIPAVLGTRVLQKGPAPELIKHSKHDSCEISANRSSNFCSNPRQKIFSCLLERVKIFF